MPVNTTDVVVTGLGATTPLGADVASTWDALLTGRSGVTRITDSWVDPFPAKLVARLAQEPSEKIDRVRSRRLDRSQQVAVVAAEEAWRDSGAGEAGYDSLRIAVVVGTGIGGAMTLLDVDSGVRLSCQCTDQGEAMAPESTPAVDFPPPGDKR